MRSEARWALLLIGLSACRSVVGLDDLSFDGVPPGAAGAAGSDAGAAGSSGVAGAATGGGAGTQAAGAGGSASSCEVGAAANACAKCERDSCCALVAACLAVEACIPCISDPSLSACWDVPAARALLACTNKSCHVACATGGTFCNPITNEGCSAGDGCDFDPSGNFTCFPPPNDQPVCAKCDPGGPYCQAGLACLGGECMVYCCEDADCGGGGGSCDKSYIGAGQLGVCVTSSGATKCDAPQPVASKGVCVPR